VAAVLDWEVLAEPRPGVAEVVGAAVAIVAGRGVLALFTHTTITEPRVGALFVLVTTVRDRAIGAA
jgi:hypothetical protein